MSDRRVLVFNETRTRLAAGTILWLVRQSKKNLRVTGQTPPWSARPLAVACEAIGPLEHGMATFLNPRVAIYAPAGTVCVVPEGPAFERPCEGPVVGRRADLALVDHPLEAEERT